MLSWRNKFEDINLSRSMVTTFHTMCSSEKNRHLDTQITVELILDNALWFENSGCKRQ